MSNLKREYKSLISEIDTVLFKKWDPIGVNHNPKLSNEYKEYTYRIIKILLKNHSAQDIVNLLRKIEIEEIGCITDDSIRYRVATKLQSLRNSYAPRLS